MKDKIIEELWRVKNELAQQFGYNLDRLTAALRQKE